MTNVTFQPVAPTGTAHLAFRVGPTRYAIPFLRVAEVRTLQNSSPVLQPPDFATGWVMLGRDPVDLLDLRKLFSRPAVLNRDTRLIVVWVPQPKGGLGRLGLIVDEIVDYLMLDESTKSSSIVGTVIGGRRVEAQACDNSDDLLLLDLDSL